ncbi:hypothetical protein HYW59_04690 [Candidatus Kaiserbacteria bacterium]|nr:hypothetical protein [Candidatus Kaiserbacteria bacterium]
MREFGKPQINYGKPDDTKLGRDAPSVSQQSDPTRLSEEQVEALTYFDSKNPEHVAKLEGIRRVVIGRLLNLWEQSQSAYVPGEVDEPGSPILRLISHIGHYVSVLAERCFTVGDNDLGNTLYHVYLISQIGRRDEDDWKILSEDNLTDDNLKTALEKDYLNLEQSILKDNKTDYTILLKTIEGYKDLLHSKLA